MRNMATENSDLHQSDHWIYLYFLLHNEVCSSSFLETDWGRHICCAYLSALLSCCVQLVGPHMICSVTGLGRKCGEGFKMDQCKILYPSQKAWNIFFLECFFPPNPAHFQSLSFVCKYLLSHQLWSPYVLDIYIYTYIDISIYTYISMLILQAEIPRPYIFDRIRKNKNHFGFRSFLP